MESLPSFIDTHVHLWNLRDHPWYPELMDDTEHAESNIANIHELRRNYLLEDYLADATPLGMTKFVHVSAAQGGKNHLSECVWLEELAKRTGTPHALIGQLEPRDELVDIADSLTTQLRSPLVKGVRITFNIDPTTDKAAEIFKRVANSGCLLEIVTQPHNAHGFANLLDRFPAMTVVVEHAGWPTHGRDPAHFAEWQRGMARLAERENTICKISGLPMALRSHDADVLRPWVEGCIDLFGDDRCMVGSNFPVDRLFGSFAQVIGSYRNIVADRDPASQARLFAGTAERVYFS